MNLILWVPYRTKQTAIMPHVLVARQSLTKEIAMAQIAPLNLETADAATAATLNAVKAKLGMVPNMFATLAHAPAALNGYLGLSETLGTGRLTAAQREIVALAAGQANRCQYCLSAHTLIGKGAGLSAEAIASGPHRPGRPTRLTMPSPALPVRWLSSAACSLPARSPAIAGPGSTTA
jgi:AhpD family alkylhydroperoxidase